IDSSAAAQFVLTVPGVPSILAGPEDFRSPAGWASRPCTGRAAGVRKDPAGAGPNRTDRDVMRQAITNMVVGLCLVLAAPTRGDGPPAGGEPPIARARRLIQAGDRAAALGILEDALIDGPAGERPTILELLGQSYEALAREAEAAGRTDEAAHY